ncbi:MAG TPA: 7-carboxy-7-deazaguanine synthase QueE [Ectothiorhodospiraceae bacterium]|nr:7-carboxy-7-deazaguanine synthase QueE [Ectothiorhodospiraceae bacterium]
MGKGEDRLRITEIFLSLQGEADAVGWPTVFVRLTGCPLRCSYCDTEYAFTGGETLTLTQIIEQVSALGVPHVCVTGGEPLSQKAVQPLMSSLCELQYNVSLETSGALPIDDVDKRVSIVMDLKTPSSDEVEKNLYSNLQHLKNGDQIKLVIADRTDYDWSKKIIEERALCDRATVLLSPAFGQLQARELAQWIIDDRLNVRMQLQLHKILWGDEQGR